MTDLKTAICLAMCFFLTVPASAHDIPVPHEHHHSLGYELAGLAALLFVSTAAVALICRAVWFRKKSDCTNRFGEDTLD